MTNKLYSAFIVVDGKEHQIELIAPATKEEAQEMLRHYQKVESAWCGLTDGSMIAVNSKCCNFHFIVKPVVGQ